MAERKNYNVTAERFVEVYMDVYGKGGTAEDVAKQLDMPKNVVITRYTNYRKSRKDGTLGVNLPALKRKKSGRSLDVNKLNEIVTANPND